MTVTINGSGAIVGSDRAESGVNDDITSLLPQVLVSKIQPITASVAANALTITLNPTSLDFRSATLGDGTVNTRQVNAAISLTISSGSKLGTINAQKSRIAVLAIDNAGTVELAAVNIAGGNDLSETGLITTVAEGGAGTADSANVIYSSTARTNVSYRVVGYVESTQDPAGTWAAAPSTIQGYGGQALAAMSSLGYGQTWQSFTVGVTRILGTTYYNTTSRPIIINISSNQQGSGTTAISVAGISFGTTSVPTIASSFTQNAVVPPGSAYSVVSNQSGQVWLELR